MATSIDSLVKTLQQSDEPAIRWKMKYIESGMQPSADNNLEVISDLHSSPLIQGLLKDQDSSGQIPYHPYNKWFGAHWVLSLLADLCYPAGDTTLKPLLEQSYAWLLSKGHFDQIKTINNRVRRCASQEGNCIYYSLALGLADDRTEELVARLIKWQWEDGGWNCDKRPEASKSSFNETLIPLRGLARYASQSGDPKARQAVEKAAEFFLKRHLFMRISDGKIIDHNFVVLHYPLYWHYDILFALKVMGDAGFLDDPRCEEAFDLLRSKQLPDGGFPAEARYYRVDDKKLSGHSRVDWGGVSKARMNPYVSMDAYSVLKKRGRRL
jgi:hypothetical protein